MANHTYVIPSKMASKDIDAYVRSALTLQDMDNGCVFNLATKNTSASYVGVWNITVPATGSMINLWMALEPEIPFLASGTNKFQGLGTVQDFYNSASSTLTAVKLVAGDTITVTSDFFIATPPALGQYVSATNGGYKFSGGAAGATEGSAFLCTKVTTIPSADGTIGSGRITAYELTCVVA